MPLPPPVTKATLPLKMSGRKVWVLGTWALMKGWISSDMVVMPVMVVVVGGGGGRVTSRGGAGEVRLMYPATVLLVRARSRQPPA